MPNRFPLSLVAAALVGLACVAQRAPVLVPARPTRPLTPRKIEERDELGLTDADFARPAPLVKRGPGLRAEAGRELCARSADTPEWRVSESAHYFFVVCGRDAVFARRLAEHAEAARALVRSFFPHPELDPVPIDCAPCVVRCAKDRDQFCSYGGPPGGRGYWNPLARELVVHGEHSDRDATTWHALQGLVFHAYMSEVFGTCALAPWFAAGNAEFFAGFDVTRTERADGPIELVPAPNATARETWRARDAQGELPPLKELLHAERFELDRYVGSMIQSWALVQHLREIERATPEHPHARILARWLAAWLEDGDAQRATEHAFAGVDLDALERDVRSSCSALGRAGDRR
ncbi:MAG: hypothetical protein HZA53_06285 [Planctomycetes bacterium]|nr:hypothetical protein [Planctomycetota bacterium]